MLLSFDVSDLQEKGGVFFSTLVQGSKEALRVQANATYQRIAKGSYFTHRTGGTLRSFQVRQSGMSASVESRSKIAHFMNVGTAPHPIVARRVPLLSFFWARMGIHFLGRSVNHPGTKATRFVHVETQLGIQELAVLVERAADRAVSSSGIG